MTELETAKELTTWDVDASHTTVQFSVKHLMVTTVRGIFNGFSGSVRFDVDNPTSLAFEATIDAGSIDTRDERRDAHLKSADFFDVENTPTILFKSTKSMLVAPGKYEVTGNLTIRGVTREIILDVSGLDQTVKDPWGGTRAGALATGRINREDFGLTWNSALESGGVLVGKEVQISIEAELIQQHDR